MAQRIQKCRALFELQATKYGKINKGVEGESHEAYKIKRTKIGWVEIMNYFTRSAMKVHQCNQDMSASTAMEQRRGEMR